jgi:hypothetical protein
MIEKGRHLTLSARLMVFPLHVFSVAVLQKLHRIQNQIVWNRTAAMIIVFKRRSLTLAVQLLLSRFTT